MTTEYTNEGNTVVADTDDVVLEVTDLSVTFPSEDGPLPAVREVSYRLRRGEAMGIVGESGSGKSVTSMAIMGLLPRNAKVEGSVRVLGQEVLGLNDKQISAVRGQKIAMIFQDPLTSLNPVYTIGYQIAEAVLAHRKVSKKAAMDRALELLEIVGIPSPEQRLKQYPHELSGGMRQRVVIAIAMANDPDVIIADEPTTALDVTVQAQVLDALQRARRETGAALVLITHDLGVVAGQVDRVGVMYAGRIVETGSVEDVFYRPRMPYALGLLGSLPRLDSDRGDRLTPILGTPPSLRDLPEGCGFAPRCPMARDLCHQEEPRLLQVEDSAESAPEDASEGGAASRVAHAAACHFSEELVGAEATDLFRATAVDTEGVASVAEMEEAESHTAGAREGYLEELGAEPEREASEAAEPEVLLTATDLVKHFPIRSKGLLRRQIGAVQAVSGVSLDLRERETLALVGESGCGKTTTAKLVLRLEEPTSGQVFADGKDVHALSGAALKEYRTTVQAVFQDPWSSLNPRMRVRQIVAEPLVVNQQISDDEVRKRVAEVLASVGLRPQQANLYPHEFSGGQRQRIAVASALVSKPKLIILDEPVSALDVSIRAQIMNLLVDLQKQYDVSYLLIAHHLATTRYMAGEVAVMYLGKIVEKAKTKDLFSNPLHPYTKALFSAALPAHPDITREEIILTGEVPSPINPPSGCRFHPRCPFAKPECSRVVPVEKEITRGHVVACHLY